MESQTSTYSNRKYSYQILDSLSIELEITDNPFNLLPEDLFVMAARRNKKRSFLFVSNVLGKHLPIKPSKGLLIGQLLAEQYAKLTAGISFAGDVNLQEQFKVDNPRLPEAFIGREVSPVIIGFAETATALGTSFFSAFKKADYFHTTREIVEGQIPLITFEEEHSHATSHRCYISPDILENRREIVLVDDEMSTGKTALNIIRSIHAKYPRDAYSVVSILDWRSDDNMAEFKRLERELGIAINCVSLLKGKYVVTGDSPEETGQPLHPRGESGLKVNKIHLGQQMESSNFYGGKLDQVPYLQCSGRFGMDVTERDKLDLQIKELAEKLSKVRKGGNALCVGTGEFMYIPMKTAAYMGDDVSFQSTTRSPIHIVNKEGYGARYGMSFPSPEEPGIHHFLYNIAPAQYDEAFLFFEREVPDNWLEPMIKEFHAAGIHSITIVYFLSKEDEHHA